MSNALPIGEAARASGVKVPTIRYYEQIGLLPAPSRSDGNRRLYGPGEIGRLSFIRHARALGFDVGAIRKLLSLRDQPNQSCEAADAIAEEHLAEIEKRIAQLVSLRDEIHHMLADGGHGRISQCAVVEVLADHELCLHPAH